MKEEGEEIRILRTELIMAVKARREAESRAESAVTALNQGGREFVEPTKEIIRLKTTIQRMYEAQAREEEYEQHEEELEGLRYECCRVRELYRNEQLERSQLQCQMEEEAKKHSTEMAKVKEERDKLAEEVTKLSMRSEKSVKEAASHLKRSESAKAQMDNVKSCRDQNNTSKLHAQIDELKRNIEELERKSREEVDRFKSQLETSEGEITALKVELERMNKNVKEALQKCGKMSKEKEYAESKLTADVKKYEKMLCDKDGEYRLLKDACERAKEQLRSSHEAELEELNAKLSDLSNAMLLLKEIHEMDKQELRSSVAELNVLKAKNTDLTGQISELKSTLVQRDMVESDARRWPNVQCSGNQASRNPEMAVPSLLDLHMSPPDAMLARSGMSLARGGGPGPSLGSQYTASWAESRAGRSSQSLYNFHPTTNYGFQATPRHTYFQNG